jgi:TetR/AcrR family transcriptional repressor of nem operon
MVRTREFDPEAALGFAMEVFWRDGYYATSIDGLVAATGVSRYGLYGEYQNKRGLFLAALDCYRATVIEQLTSALFAPHASLPVIRDFLQHLADRAGKPAGRSGCLLCNTANEVAPHDKAAARKVADFRAHLAAGFRAALANGVAKGELPRGFDVGQEADFLAGVVQALSTMARSRAEPGAIANFVSVSLSTLR